MGKSAAPAANPFWLPRCFAAGEFPWSDLKHVLRRKEERENEEKRKIRTNTNMK
jgi:hypothetical protein